MAVSAQWCPTPKLWKSQQLFFQAQTCSANETTPMIFKTMFLKRTVQSSTSIFKQIWRHKNTVSKENGCKEILIPSRMVSLAAAWRFPLGALSWISSDVVVQVIEVDLWLLFIEAGVVQRVWQEHTGLHLCRLFEECV